MEGEDELELSDDGFCVGSKLCYGNPHNADYVPPHIYHILPHPTHKWEVGASLGFGAVPHMKIKRIFVLPHFLGLGDNGRWRWQFVPLCSSLGLKIEPKARKDCFLNLHLIPHFHLKSLTPIFGKLALQPSVEVSEVYKAKLQKDFIFGKGKLVAGASIEVGRSHEKLLERTRWVIKLDWYPSENSRIQSKLGNDALSMQYTRNFNLTQNSKFEISALTHTLPLLPFPQIQRHLRGLENFRMRLTQSIGMMVSKEEPLPTSLYLEALKDFGKCNTISIVPGHWIDPGIELGAPGERDFNLEVANITERKLRLNCWKVLRPDRDAPNLLWEEYLNWVSRQTCKGRPVLEIHGQGPTADYRGLIYGVIGNEKSSLSKELANEFGIFEMDWTGLGLPRRGGIIVESFNTDEVLQMDPSQRISYARKIATRISKCIETASSRYRSQQDDVKSQVNL